MSTEVKDRIAAIDEFGRILAANINARIVAEGLKGQSPATIRRVEELIAEVVLSIEAQEAAAKLDPPVVDSTRDFEFAIMKGGLTVAPLVTVARYTGRVG